MVDVPWTETQIDECRRLAADGLSARGIAEQIGEGRTRSAVIGVAFRHDIKLMSGKSPTANSNFNYVPKWKREKTTLREPPAVPSLRVPLSMLEENQCRYIGGSDRLYCGQPRDVGSPWCVVHREFLTRKIESGSRPLPTRGGSR